MAMNIHMSTRFIQLRSKHPHSSLLEIILLTTKKMVWPIIYTVLTTMIAFLSLVFSDIKPIIDFGLMMSFGLLTSFIVTFTILPTLLNLFDSKKVYVEEKSFSTFTKMLSEFSINNKKLIASISIFLMILSVIGILKLKVENSFINYFSKDTEIYKGMKLIDEKLGGTTPLNIILKFDSNEMEVVKEEEDQFDDWDEESSEADQSKYWFTKDKIDRIKNVHLYLEKLDYVGKVLSFYSIIEIATKLNNDKELGTLEMGVLYSKLPDTIKKEIVDPYISVENNEARINLRIKDSSENLRRNLLINKINKELKTEVGLKDNDFKLSGILILFNNLLQSLFKSQILTLGFVMLGIFLMFLILFRNLKISLIGVIPNFIAAFAILGLIGILNIPLDMMTITIAAITIGIAVDNSIHYIYRFIEEYKINENYKDVIKICHSTVGIAIFNTSITIVFGFSILILSNFIPTIYFGIFTGIAMLLAMLLVLTLLPSLILLMKPFGIVRNV
tara:strand:- start:1 stop:1506 length:1506 start_codon:yes stop_codon:yes gene_type:complete